MDISSRVGISDGHNQWGHFSLKVFQWTHSPMDIQRSGHSSMGLYDVTMLSLIGHPQEPALVTPKNMTEWVSLKSFQWTIPIGHKSTGILKLWCCHPLDSIPAGPTLVTSKIQPIGILSAGTTVLQQYHWAPAGHKLPWDYGTRFRVDHLTTRFTDYLMIRYQYLISWLVNW